jgi:hypothetical protein
MLFSGRWGNNGFGRQQNGLGGVKRWESKSFAGNMMKGNDMANRNKPSHFSTTGKPTHAQVGDSYGYGRRMGGENKFSVLPPPPPPPPSSGNMNWGKQFSQPPKANSSTATVTTPKTSKPALSVKEMCNVQGIAAPGNSNAYNYPAFLNAYGCTQLQAVQQ